MITKDRQQPKRLLCPCTSEERTETRMSWCIVSISRVADIVLHAYLCLAHLILTAILWGIYSKSTLRIRRPRHREVAYAVTVIPLVIDGTSGFRIQPPSFYTVAVSVLCGVKTHLYGSWWEGKKSGCRTVCTSCYICLKGEEINIRVCVSAGRGCPVALSALMRIF